MNAHLKLSPHSIGEDWWWYEERKGICIVYDNGTANIQMASIPWAHLRDAIARKDRKKNASIHPARRVKRAKEVMVR